MKKLIKKQLEKSLPSLLRRFELPARARIFRSAISNVNLLSTLDRSAVVDLLVNCGRTLNLAGFMHSGEAGVYCGLTQDENVHRQYILLGRWSPSLYEFLRDLVFRDRRGTYIDVGANIGLTVIPVAMLGGIRCIAVEPEPKNFRMLRVNSLLNGVEADIENHNVAAMSKSGDVDMSLSDWNSGDHQIVSQIGVDSNSDSNLRSATVRVRAARLDDLLDINTVSHPVVCKIDTQGAELEVLEGAGELLKVIDVLTIEFWPHGLKRMNGDAEALLDALADFRFGTLIKLDDKTNAALSIDEPIGEVFRRAIEFSRTAEEDDYWDLILSKEPISTALPA